MSVENDIKQAVAGQVPNRGLRSESAPFMELRAKVRGTLINAHRTLGPKEWDANDDRILDIISQWLDNCRDRGNVG